MASYDIEYAAWESAGQQHQEEFRNSGNNPSRSAWLVSQRLMALKDALAAGELMALGIAGDDPELAFQIIPANLFLAGNSKIDAHAGSVVGLGRQYQDVHVCRVGAPTHSQAGIAKSTGRPSHLAIILDAWEALKADDPAFLELPKTKQNLEIREKAKSLFANQFPGQCRIGDSTIRRHRRKNPELFY